jgi:hypothetical protein
VELFVFVEITMERVVKSYRIAALMPALKTNSPLHSLCFCRLYCRNVAAFPALIATSYVLLTYLQKTILFTNYLKSSCAF